MPFTLRLLLSVNFFLDPWKNLKFQMEKFNHCWHTKIPLKASRWGRKDKRWCASKVALPHARMKALVPTFPPLSFTFSFTTGQYRYMLVFFNFHLPTSFLISFYFLFSYKFIICHKSTSLYHSSSWLHAFVQHGVDAADP